MIQEMDNMSEKEKTVKEIFMDYLPKEGVTKAIKKVGEIISNEKNDAFLAGYKEGRKEAMKMKLLETIRKAVARGNKKHAKKYRKFRKENND